MNKSNHKQRKGSSDVGEGFTLHCKHCKNKYEIFLGTGFDYPIKCHEILRNMKVGCYGNTCEKLSKETQNAVIHFSNDLFICEQCGIFKNDRIINLCVPTEKTPKKKGRFSTVIDYDDHVKYVVDIETENYKVIHSIKPICDRCHTKMKKVNVTCKCNFSYSDFFETVHFAEKILCPKCHRELQTSEKFEWD